jgi:hypothetical protein
MRNSKSYGQLSVRQILISGLLAALLLTSCAPVNRFSRLKRTPREYSINYCHSDIRARKTSLNRETWIVFSDGDNNETWQNPGGKVKMKSMSFMEAFFVIREKGDYLQLVKYDPEIVANSPYARIIKNRKKAQYYGWAHRSRLLLTRQSSTDMATGFRNKAIVVVADSLAVSQPGQCFDTDSVICYKDANLSVCKGKIPMHEILYILKVSADNRKILLSGTETLNPLSASEEAIGWASKSAISELGQRLFVDMGAVEGELSDRHPTFLDRECRDTLTVDAETARSIDIYRKSRPEFRYNPARSFRRDSGVASFRTALPAPVIDKRFTYVLNLNGNKIMYSDLLCMERDLRRINLVFVFEGKERVFREYSRIMNVAQNMQAQFGDADERYRYRFGAVISYADTSNSGRLGIKSCPLTESHADFMEFLMLEADSVSRYAPIADRQAWRGLEKAVEMAEAYKKESNLFVVVGESGYSELADSVLVGRIADVGGRILGYQTYSEKLSDADNNFVLQIENMIDACSQRDAVFRRERLVYPGQYKPRQEYRESGRNAYALDYPHRSMTQGWVVFPGKNEDMQLEVLAAALDTLVMDAKHDGDTVISCIHKAFSESGLRRSRYGELFCRYSGMDSLWDFNHEFQRLLPSVNPAWLLPSVNLQIENAEVAAHYRLLLSETELAEITGFLEEITKYEPDYKYKSRKKKAKKPCNCPEDNIRGTEVPRGELRYDRNGHALYLNTRQIRKHIYKTFMSRLKSSRKYVLPCAFRLRRHTPAAAVFEIAGNPADEKIMNAHRIKDIKSKRKVKDFELDELLLYFRSRKEELKNRLRTDGAVSFVSNGKTYYWIKMELLP